jgi:uncharacterized protein (TIGR02058 family)
MKETPEIMDKVLFVEIGTGIDQHGQDVTVAAVRAIHDAIHRNALPGMRELLPERDLGNMRVHVTLAVPADRNRLDIAAVRKVFPYGQVEVDVVSGGLAARSYSVLPEQGDRNDTIYVVNVAIAVGY